MRSSVFLGSFLCASIFAASAQAAQSHYLLARAFNQFNGTKAISAPDLTGVLDAEYKEGAEGMGTAFISNKTEVSTVSGKLRIKSAAAQAAGATNVNPKGWDLAARIEQNFTGSPKPTTVVAKLVITTAGSIVNVQPTTMDYNATLDINGCSIHVKRQKVSTSVNVPDEVVDNCSLPPPYAATFSGSELQVTAPFQGTVLGLSVQLDMEFNYATTFEGQVGSVDFTGDLSMNAVGGTLVPTSPTFLTGGGPVDGGSSGASGSSGSSGASGSSGSSGASGSGGPAADAGSAGAAAPSGSDDGGCNAGAASPVSSTAAGIGFALVAATIARRARRIRDSRAGERR